MTLGIEMADLNLESVSIEQLRELLAEHGVLILPNQPVDDQRFLAFLRR